MNARIRNRLIHIANTGGQPIAYQKMIDELDLGLDLEISYEKEELGIILNEISAEEHKQGRPLLSAMVKNKAKGQGDNFFKLCDELGMGDWRELKSDKAFMQQHRDACKEFWQNEDNFNKYL
ncbi:MAG: hypothetical protein LAT68_09835 [Cyclobacteriaceae bacterium]|nr:hypothetical protein [Cyclobacteriaceae bacterium]MCH8516616.1 hypothetical protein [Cyclobacteriaceae bacterium]